MSAMGLICVALTDAKGHYDIPSTVVQRFKRKRWLALETTLMPVAEVALMLVRS